MKHLSSLSHLLENVGVQKVAKVDQKVAKFVLGAFWNKSHWGRLKALSWQHCFQVVFDQASSCPHFV